MKKQPRLAPVVTPRVALGWLSLVRLLKLARPQHQDFSQREAERCGFFKKKKTLEKNIYIYIVLYGLYMVIYLYTYIWLYMVINGD